VRSALPERAIEVQVQSKLALLTNLDCARCELPCTVSNSIRALVRKVGASIRIATLTASNPYNQESHRARYQLLVMSLGQYGSKSCLCTLSPSSQATHDNLLRTLADPWLRP
jgi:hypothetical protein